MLGTSEAARAGTVGSRVAEVTVRAARPSDLDQLLSLYVELAADKLSAQPADGQRSRPILQRILAQPSRHLLVAELEGRLAGTVDMLVVQNLTHHGAPWAVVENVIVSERYRRHGVARALFERAIETAQESGCCKLELMSGKHRSGAHAFYRSVGMEAVAEGFKVYFDA